MKIIFLFYVLLFSAPSWPKSLFEYGDQYVTTVGKSYDIPHGIITTINQDVRGLMWFGTYEGLLQFDGYSFTKFTHSPQDHYSITGDYILAIEPDHDGGIWIGTNNDGISYFDPRTGKFKSFNHNLKDKSSISSNKIKSLSLASKGLYVGTDNGLNYFDIELQEFSIIEVLGTPDRSPLNVSDVIIDNNDSVWVGSNNGLFLQRKGLHGLQEFNGSQFKEVDIYKLIVTQNNLLWVGTRNNGLAVIDLVTGATKWLNNTIFKEGLMPWIMDFSETNDNALWVSTFGHGIWKIDIQSQKLVEQIQHDKNNTKGLFSNDTSAIFQSKDGNVWVGHWGKGLQRIDLNHSFIRHLNIDPRYIGNEGIFALTALHDNTLIVGGKFVALFSHLNASSEVKKIDAINSWLNSDIVTSITQTKDKYIWVGSRQKGLLRLDSQFKPTEIFNTQNGLNSNLIRHVTPSKDGGLWIGTNSGINKWHTDGKITRLSFASNKALNASSEGQIELMDGSFWFSSYSSLFMVPAGGAHVIQIIDDLTLLSPLTDKSIDSIFSMPNGQIGLSSNGKIFTLSYSPSKPLELILLDERLSKYSIESGHNMVWSDDNNLWTAREHVDLRSATVKKHNRESGIDIGTNWNGAKAKFHDNTILFGGNAGLMMINPSPPENTNFRYSTLIQNVKVDDKSIPIEQNIVTLPPNPNNIEIQFSALSYAAIDQVRYEYRLFGYDENWNESSSANREVLYRHVPPGSYKFSVSAYDENGHIVSNESHFELVISPSWYQTLLFKFFVITSVFISIYFAHYLRLKYEEKKALRMEKLIEERTQELNEKNKQIEHMANHDMLTELPSLRLAKDRLDIAINIAKRDRTKVVVLFLDLDGFKQINDTHGHDVGDMVLVETASRIKQAIREADTACRIGGDEFMVILANIKDEEPIIQTCHRLIQRIGRPISVDGEQLSIGVSIGGASFPDHASDGLALRKVADQMMYDVKRSGRNNYKLAKPKVM